MKFRHLIAWLVLALSAPSWAATDLGTIDATGKDFSRDFIRLFGLGSPLGSFQDDYTFTLVGGNAAAGGTVSFDLGFVDLKLNSVALSAPGMTTQTGNAPGNFTFSNLTQGVQYTLSVFGTLTSHNFDLGYAYYEGTIRAVASAAPEPGPLALGLAGLLGVTLLVRRRAQR